MNSEPLPPHYRWNSTALMIGYISFGISFTFINVNTVMPALVGQLTDSAPLIGLVGTIFSGGWLLPQLLVARLVRDKPRMKPYMLMGMSGRITLVVIAVALWAGLARYPEAMLALFYICIGLFISSDALATVPWFDFIARAIPPRRRGRLIGGAQVVSGIAGLGVGALIGLILDSPRLGFPNNYALLFALGAVSLIPSTIAVTTLREPPPKRSPPPTTHQNSAHWLTSVIRDPAFRGAVICRILISMVSLATPFYVGHASEVLHLPARVIGAFVVAQTVGGIIGSAILGPVCERWGAHAVIRAGSVVVVIAPLFALLAHLAGGGWLGQTYPLVYAALGALNAVRMLGFSNYILEIAPEGARTSYVGLSNTLAGVITIAPTLGGLLLEASSYTVLFGLTTVLAAAGFLYSLRLTPGRARNQPVQPEIADGGALAPNEAQ